MLASLLQLRIRDLTPAQLHGAIQSAAVLLLLQRSQQQQQQQQQQNSSSSSLDQFARSAFCLYEERLHLIPLIDVMSHTPPFCC